MSNYPTPHIDAAPADFAKTVLMPGDPLRARFIAETFLEKPRLVNNVRGIQGYTGTYLGKAVSVMASGMGMPSMGIYSYELFRFFGVETILRIGSAGGLQKDIHLRDLVFGMGACTDSAFAAQFRLPGTFAPICSFSLLRRAAEIASEKGLPYHVGNLISSDCFYGDEAGLPWEETSAYLWGKMDVMAIEMEAAALYMNAARARGEGFPAKALAICTISDHFLTKESTSAAERQSSFTHMMELALQLASEQA